MCEATSQMIDLIERLYAMSQFSEKPQPSSYSMFLEEILQASSASHLQGEEREQKMQELDVELDDYIAMRFIETMSEIDVQLFERLLQRQPPPSMQECQEFMLRHVPNYLDTLTLILLEFRVLKLNQQ